MGKLDGMVAAVTGGASGIGEATVRRFIAEGAQVAFADRDAERGRRVAEEIAAGGGKVVFVEADVGREATCLGFIGQTVERFGRLNVLVNNAGIRKYQTVVEASAESWDEILNVNLKSYAFCAKGAIPAMRQAGGGSIVNVASIRSVIAGGNNIQYDTTKHAVAGLTAWRWITGRKGSASTPSVPAPSSPHSMRGGCKPPAKPLPNTMTMRRARPC
jgi:NAD(P)-dependent dehydrogenase (short-subunit alcohol dehydrogenase family)